MKRALVVGCKGQDGSYLVEQLAGRGYQVTGIDRGGADSPDIRDAAQVESLIAGVQPDEVYYLAAFHHSSEAVPLDDSELLRRSFDINTLALQHFLHAIASRSPRSRLFYAASSHVFGEPREDVQDEDTPLQPVDAYGISKAAGLQLCRSYRRKRGLYCSAGLLYNHESPRRSPEFVSRKIVSAAVRISRKLQDRLVVADLESKVDWGFAPDYTDAMWRILQLEAPEDFIIASGELHSVGELVRIAFDAVGLDWREFVEVDERLVRRSRGSRLQGNNARLRGRTGWRPSTDFREMILAMVEAEHLKIAAEYQR